MGKIPLWKLKREAFRLWSQLRIPYELVIMPARRRLYDSRKESAIRISPGSRSVGDNVAIILIYQPSGVNNSLLGMLRHMNKNGFTPIVVSNTALTRSDRENICGEAYQVIERPNFGYDFGGYREGVLYLLENNIIPENLIFINDSIWFPVRKGCNFLDRVKKEHADLFGVVLSERPDAPSRTHLQSYFFNFKKRVIRDPAFKDFWVNLFLSSNKFLVIRKCEMKLTRYFSDRGFSVNWFCSQKDLNNALLSLTNSELEVVIKYQIQVDPKNSYILEELLRSKFYGSDWRQQVKELVEKKVLGKYILISHPLLLIDRLELPILKKDKQEIYQKQRDELLLNGLDEIIIPEVKAELREY